MTIGLGEDARLVYDAADRILRETCSKELVDAAEAGEWPAALWRTLEEAGLTRACAPAALGGAELPPAQGFALLRLVGAYAVPVPLADTLVATWLLGEAGVEELPFGPLSIALAAPDRISGAALAGTIDRVAFAPRAERVLIVVPGHEDTRLLVIDPADRLKDVGVNLAGEPMASLCLDGLDIDRAATCALDLETVRGHLALTRALMISGALGSMLELGTRYALERNQFGRAIAKFQAVQQQLAVLAGEAAVAIRAADGALEALEGEGALTEMAVAKARAGEAAGRGAEIAHQVHGAMGFTHEHQLHHRTRRAWAWRDEFGHEAYWQAWLGHRVAAQGPERLWAFMTGTA